MDSDDLEGCMFNANFWRGRRGGEWKMEEEKHRDRKTLRVYSFTKSGSKIERKKRLSYQEFTIEILL